MQSLFNNNIKYILIKLKSILFPLSCAKDRIFI